MVAQVRLGNTEAVIAPFRFEMDGKPISLRGRLTATSAGFTLNLSPAAGALELVDAPAGGMNLSVVRLLGAGADRGESHLSEAFVRGIFFKALSLTVASENRAEPDALNQRTFFFNSAASDATPLLLRVSSEESSPIFQLAPKR